MNYANQKDQLRKNNKYLSKEVGPIAVNLRNPFKWVKKC